MAGKNGIAEKIVTAFEAELDANGWAKEPHQSMSLDKYRFRKDKHSIGRRDPFGVAVYTYHGTIMEVNQTGSVTVKRLPDEFAKKYVEDVPGEPPRRYELEVLGCMQKAEELVKRNG